MAGIQNDDPRRPALPFRFTERERRSIVDRRIPRPQRRSLHGSQKHLSRRRCKIEYEAKKKYKVILTRGRDVFLPLKDRVRVAQEAKADLFISLHADSIANRNVRGGAVYTLSEMGSDAEADALAARENKSDLIAGVALGKHDDEVVSILIELAQRESMNYAAQFANVLVLELRQIGVPMRVKPHRFAAFRVLKAPDVPSILLELGYLTNQQDERYLLSPQARRSVARSIANAVDRYFRDLKG